MPERHEIAAIIHFWQAKVFRRNAASRANSGWVLRSDEKNHSSAAAE
jgi:hypothetical protein